MIARHACEVIAQVLQVDYGATQNGGSIELIAPPLVGVMDDRCRSLQFKNRHRRPEVGIEAGGHTLRALQVNLPCNADAVVLA